MDVRTRHCVCVYVRKVRSRRTYGFRRRVRTEIRGARGRRIVLYPSRPQQRLNDGTRTVKTVRACRRPNLTSCPTRFQRARGVRPRSYCDCAGAAPICRVIARRPKRCRVDSPPISTSVTIMEPTVGRRLTNVRHSNNDCAVNDNGEGLRDQRHPCTGLQRQRANGRQNPLAAALTACLFC